MLSSKLLLKAGLSYYLILNLFNVFSSTESSLFPVMRTNLISEQFLV